MITCARLKAGGGIARPPWIKPKNFSSREPPRKRKTPEPSFDVGLQPLYVPNPLFDSC
jgi:hypothetical protein